MAKTSSSCSISHDIYIYISVCFTKASKLIQFDIYIYIIFALKPNSCFSQTQNQRTVGHYLVYSTSRCQQSNQGSGGCHGVRFLTHTVPYCTHIVIGLVYGTIYRKPLRFNGKNDVKPMGFRFRFSQENQSNDIGGFLFIFKVFGHSFLACSPMSRWGMTIPISK